MAEPGVHKGKLIGAAVLILLLVIAAASCVYRLFRRNTPALDTRNF